MRIGVILIIVMLLLSCRGTKFTYVTNKFIDSNFFKRNPIVLDSTYQLYLRQVIKVYDDQKKIYVPTNGQVSKGIELIELEYLFLSPAHSKVLIINNIPNSKKKFYNSDDKLFDFSAASDDFKVDIWYFRQFRFGVLEEGSRFKFSDIEGTEVKHDWHYIISANEDTIELKSISIKDEYGEVSKNIDAAFALKIIYVRVNNFSLVFKNNASKTLRSSSLPEYELPHRTFYVSEIGTKNFLIFKFYENISKHFSNIIFHNERIYSNPYKN